MKISRCDIFCPRGFRNGDKAFKDRGAMTRSRLAGTIVSARIKTPVARQRQRVTTTRRNFCKSIRSSRQWNLDWTCYRVLLLIRESAIRKRAKSSILLVEQCFVQIQEK